MPVGCMTWTVPFAGPRANGSRSSWMSGRSGVVPANTCRRASSPLPRPPPPWPRWSPPPSWSSPRTARTSPGAGRKVGIFRSGQELAAWIAGADGPPRVGSGDRQLRPFTPGRPTEADQIRSAGARQYETELARISRTADQLETAFSSFLERQWDGKVRGHFDRSFYALWEDGALQGRPFPGAEFRFSDLRRRAESLRGILRLAEEQARRADVFPGDRRDLRARYRLEHRGWE